jgi:predicted ester cyclase
MRPTRSGRAVVLVALLLTLVTSVFGVQTLRLLRPTGVQGFATVGEDARLVGDFYVGLNGALATGELGGVRRLLAPDFLDRTPPPGVAPTRDGFLGRLVTLRQTYPDLRIVADDLTAQDRRVVARVRVEGEDGRFLGLPVPVRAAWGTVDVFRVDDGRIAEHWGEEGGGSAFAAVATLPIALAAPARLIPTLERRTYDPAASEELVATAGPTVLIVDGGTLTAEALRSRDGVAGTPEATRGGLPGRQPLESGRSAPLVAGDVLVVPPGWDCRVTNEERSAASARVVTLTAPAAGGMAMGALAAGGHGKGDQPQGIARTVLAGGLAATVPVGAADLAIGRLDLAVGVGIGAHDVVGPELLAVDDGTLTVAIAGGTSWVQRGGTGAASSTLGAVVGAGDGASVIPDGNVAYANTGSTPVHALAVILRPVGGAAATPVASN